MLQQFQPHGDFSANFRGADNFAIALTGVHIAERKQRARGLQREYKASLQHAQRHVLIAA